jgi:hypothetical protein
MIDCKSGEQAQKSSAGVLRITGLLFYELEREKFPGNHLEYCNRYRNMQ